MSLKHRLKRNLVYQALSVVLNRVCSLSCGFPFPYHAALQFEQLAFMLSSQTHPPAFPAHHGSWAPGSEDWPRVKCTSPLHHDTDTRGRSRCVSACGTQDSILKHGFLLTPCVQKLEGRNTELVLCGFFALTFFTVFSFLLSTFGQALLFFL